MQRSHQHTVKCAHHAMFTPAYCAMCTPCSFHTSGPCNIHTSTPSSEHISTLQYAHSTPCNINTSTPCNVHTSTPCNMHTRGSETKQFGNLMFHIFAVKKKNCLFFCFIFVCFIFKGIWLINFKTFHQKCLLGVVWFCSLLTFVCLWICFEK